MRGRVGVRVAVALVVALVSTGCAWLERSSVGPDPGRVAGGAASRSPSVSQSGRYTAFESDASNLVPGDTNGVSDVFVRDNVAHVTTRVSVAADGMQGNGASTAPDLSDDGRYVAFLSKASNLAPDDTTAIATILVHDRVTKANVVASVDSDEVGISVTSDPVISGDGRTVAFTTITGFPDVPVVAQPFGPIVRHLDLGTTSDLRGDIPLGYAVTMPGPISLSDDGTRVASIAYLISGDHLLGRATVLDTTTGAVIADLGNDSIPLFTTRLIPIALSGDGTHFALGFVPPDDGPTRGAIRVGRVSDPGSARMVPSEYAADVALSDSGALLATRTRTIFGDVVMVADPAQGGFHLVSRNAGGTNVVVVGSFALSGDGEWVAFDSIATDVAPGDARGVRQVYTRSVRSPLPPPPQPS